MDVFRNGRFEADDWITLDAEDDAPVAPGTRVLVPLLRWRAEGKRLAATAAAVGLVLAGDDPVEVLDDGILQLPVIAIAFPKFTDGRGYSIARLLRERLGYAGELRATGDVLADQIPLMWRCGFNALVVEHGPTRAALAEGRLARRALHMQPVGAAEAAPTALRPWLRAAPARPVAPDGGAPNYAGC